jgi:hypothetical protein
MSNPARSWVVYLTGLAPRAGAANAVCEQAEWDAMERLRPGQHTLVRSGLATEAEAEKFARAGLVAAERAEAEERKRQRAARAEPDRGAG